MGARVAVWSSAAEQGEARPTGPAFYVSQETDMEIGVLAAALLRAKGGRLPLLPQGEARIEPIGEAQAKEWPGAIRPALPPLARVASSLSFSIRVTSCPSRAR